MLIFLLNSLRNPGKHFSRIYKKKSTEIPEWTPVETAGGTPRGFLEEIPVEILEGAPVEIPKGTSKRILGEMDGTRRILEKLLESWKTPSEIFCGNPKRNH